VIRYRRFRNGDPPAIADLWNECFTNRGTYSLGSLGPLERAVFSKPFFDPAGFIVAEDASRVVGFVHAGFGPNEDETDLEATKGVICSLAVHEHYRRHGIGSELLCQAEDYLHGRGANVLFAGPKKPLNPFYLGLYGGCELPGFLLSDPAAAPFFEHHRYAGRQTTLVFQCRLDQPLVISDARFAQHRRQYEIQIIERAGINSWWQECVFGLSDPLEIRLEEKGSGLIAARAMAWELEGFSGRWNSPAAGVFDLVVRPELRRRGLARFLIVQILKYLQEQFFAVCEMQTPELNPAAVGLLRSLEFVQVDAGRVYQKLNSGEKNQSDPA